MSDCDRAGTPEDGAVLAQSGRRWHVLSHLRLGAPPDEALLDHVLIHPACGVALMSRADAAEDAEQIVALFRMSLERGEFETFFPGYLPVVFVPGVPRDIAGLQDALAHAFARAPRLSIHDHAWAESLAAVLDSKAHLGAPEADTGLHVDPALRPTWSYGRTRLAWAVGSLLVIAMIALAIALPRRDNSSAIALSDQQASVPIAPPAHEDALPPAALPPAVAQPANLAEPATLEKMAAPEEPQELAAPSTAVPAPTAKVEAPPAPARALTTRPAPRHFASSAARAQRERPVEEADTPAPAPPVPASAERYARPSLPAFPSPATSGPPINLLQAPRQEVGSSPTAASAPSSLATASSRDRAAPLSSALGPPINLLQPPQRDAAAASPARPYERLEARVRPHGDGPPIDASDLPPEP